ncbi:MAG TPA: DUF309 domain-containing protein [Acidisarcina sp.]|nr:DUF309 domain-containing protein [Acidisarcina sp.]
MKFDWTSGGLAEGLRCYRACKFFDAHEHWEGVWLHLPEPQKTFLQALIQTAAAFHHLQRHNTQGTISLLHTALRRLELYADPYEGISVAPLREEIRNWLRLLEAGDASVQLPFPEIRQHS